MWNTVLFDLDGTLTESGEGITKCVQYALRKEFSIKVDDIHELDSFVGPPLKEQFMEYANLTPDEADRAIRAYRERYRTRGIYENRVYDGIPELLSQLAREGMVLAVSSSKPTEFCREILRYFGIEQYFRAIVGSEMGGARTKKSEVLEETLRQLGMSGRRSEVVLVGDRMYDVEGAKQAGIGSIGVTYGYGSRTELEECWPDCIVDSTEELRNVLIGQARDEQGEMRRALGGASAGADPGNPPAGYPRLDAGGSQQYYFFPPQGYGVPGRTQPTQGFYPPYPYPLPGYNYPPQGYYAPQNYPDIRAYDPQSQLGSSPYGNLSGNVPQYPRKKESAPYKLWRILYPLLLELGISIACSNLIVALIIMFSRDLYTANQVYSRNSILIMGIMDCVIILVFALLYRADERKRALSGPAEGILRMGHVNFLQIVAVILFVCGLSAVITMLTSYIPIPKSDEYSTLEKSIENSGVVLQLLVICVSGPLAEELLYRGIIFRRIRDYLGCGWAAVLSGLIFGIAHGNLEQGIYAMLFGIVLALIYEHYGTIWAPIAAHTANNVIATFVDPIFSGMGAFGQSIYLACTFAVTIVFGLVIFSKSNRVNSV